MLFILLFFVVVIVIMIRTCFPKDDYSYNKNNSRYQSYISSASPMHCPDNKEFEQERDRLVEEIRQDMNETDNILRKKILESLLRRPLFVIDDLVKLDYLYNDGNLRSDEEADYMEHYFATKDKRENFDHERHKVNTIAFLVPFLTVFVLCCIIFDNVITTPLSLLFGLIAGFIGMIIGYSINIKKAEEYCISKNDPRVQDEIAKRRTAIIAGMTSGSIVGHHAKKTVKDVTNVNSWSKMK